MKRILVVFAIASFLAACNNQSKIKEEARLQAVKVVKDSLKLDSFKRAQVALQEKEKIQKEKAEQEAQVRRNTSVKGYSEYGNSPAQAPAAKKGWSSAAKGAVIGGGAGAVTGILVDKKNARGAIIGGVVGAGTGYVIGRAQDRKSGRVVPKN